MIGRRRAFMAAHAMSDMEYSNLREMLRNVFSDHAVYTKFVVTDILENLPNASADLSRLMKNQEDIGNVLSSYIGVEKAMNLINLLRTHVDRVGACVNALKTLNNSDITALEIAKTALFANSDQIGDFLTSLNPDKLTGIKPMFRQHNQYVLDIASAQKNKEYARVVTLFDEYYDHMMAISDMICMALMM